MEAYGSCMLAPIESENDWFYLDPSIHEFVTYCNSIGENFNLATATVPLSNGQLTEKVFVQKKTAIRIETPLATETTDLPPIPAMETTGVTSPASAVETETTWTSPTPIASDISPTLQPAVLGLAIASGIAVAMIVATVSFFCWWRRRRNARSEMGKVSSRTEFYGTAFSIFSESQPNIEHELHPEHLRELHPCHLNELHPNARLEMVASMPLHRFTEISANEPVGKELVG
ncbi:hypothetical protein HJFPF1_08127 [Paramyrothecium foliicola]|nr:hypothetical protein HJFPF1_08127 [Paramyrothecium foliicola]